MCSPNSSGEGQAILGRPEPGENPLASVLQAASVNSVCQFFGLYSLRACTQLRRLSLNNFSALLSCTPKPRAIRFAAKEKSAITDCPSIGSLDNGRRAQRRRRRTARQLGVPALSKADNDDDVPDTVEVVALDAEPTVEEAQPTIAETLTATARAAYATASSLVDAVANDTPPPPIDLDETPPPSPVATSSPRKKPAPIVVKELAAAAASVGVTSPEAFRSGGPVANSPPASPKAWKAPPKADSPEARHRTMWKPRSPSIEKPAAPSPEAFRPGGRVRNSPPPSPVPHAGGLDDAFPPRTQKPYFEPDDAYDRPGPVPLSNYAAGPRLGPARLPVAVRQAGRAAAWDAAPGPAPAAPAARGVEPEPEPNPRASREEPFNPRASRESLRASRDRDAELQTLRRRVDAAEREAASLRDQARRDRQVKLDAEAEARTLNDELARARTLIDQLRDDAVEAAAARGRDAVAVEALAGPRRGARGRGDARRR